MKRYLLVIVEGGEITLIDTVIKKEFSVNWEDVDIQVFLQEEENDEQPELGL
jgi:hypothetical protein